MYPRNNATPPRIAIGAVVQISDGAVQSSGVSVVVRAEGGSETAGGGTISYGGTTSIVYYVPTQAETNYTAFVVVAYKTGCFPCEKTVVTSAATTAGQVVTDSASRTGSQATGFATPANVTDSRDAITARLPAALVSGRIDASVGAIATDAVSAASVAAAAVTKIQTGLATPTNITAGTITTVTNLTNAPTSGDLTATMKASVTTAVPNTGQIAAAVWAAGTRTLTAISDSSGITTLLSRITALLQTKSQADADQTATISAIDGLNDFDPATDEVIVGTNNDKTGYALTQTFPTNFEDLAIEDTTGKVTTSNPAAGSGSSHTASDVAALILATPANKLATNVSGEVVASNMRGTDSAALAATALSTAVWTNTKAGFIDAAISSVSSGGGLDAAGIRSAIGLASANLDTQLADIPTAAEFNARTLVAASYATNTSITTVDTVVDQILAEVGKVPRGASAIAAGGNATRTKVSANGTTLVEAIT